MPILYSGAESSVVLLSLSAKANFPRRSREAPLTHAEAHAPATGEIDLAVVHEIMSHFEPRDFQESQELILSALQEINEHFGWVSLEAAEIVAEHLGTTPNRIYGLLTFYADFRTEPRGKHFMLLCHGMACYVMGSQRLVQNLEDVWGIADGD